ncbi:MAG: hypothetical protein Q7U53_17280 [Anaerolineaceae bacterium]|nr:hypothetical protein [Anaerolineaceae bacterium]
MHRIILILAILIILTTACTPAQTPTPTQTVAPTITMLPTPTPTPIPLPAGSASSEQTIEANEILYEVPVESIVLLRPIAEIETLKGISIHLEALQNEFPDLSDWQILAAVDANVTQELRFSLVIKAQHIEQAVLVMATTINADGTETSTTTPAFFEENEKRELQVKTTGINYTLSAVNNQEELGIYWQEEQPLLARARWEDVYAQVWQAGEWQISELTEGWEWDGVQWERMYPDYPDWATAALENEQATVATINKSTVMLRGFRENETSNNTSENERILFVLNQELNQWEVPLPTIEQSYAKYVNPFKTKTFATRELDSYAPELFEIPSLEPKYLRHWLQEYSKQIISSDKVDTAVIDLNFSNCPEMGNFFASTITCRIDFRPYTQPLLVKYDNYLVMTFKANMPLSNNESALGAIHITVDYETLNIKAAEYWQKTFSWLEGLEASFIDMAGYTIDISPTIGPIQSFSSFPGEEIFRTIMDTNNPELAEKLFRLISTKGKETEDAEREMILEQMSESIIPALYQLFNPEMLPPNKSDWTVTP